ncbi:MAG: hypothetical protein H6594_03775 [Flavobacteriales bacterium]|nr:hypothetical protein [Flavobacteriales bacterium]
MIHDCFTFFNELDLLEIRLNELDDVVDRFVLVEATRTHQGKPKPLHYAENKHRFSAFHHKIEHVVVDRYPANADNDAWVFEKHQRNSIAEGLRKTGPTDVVMISDVDEIPRPEKVREAMNRRGVRIFRQRMFYYYLNCQNITSTYDRRTYAWNGTVMVNASEIDGPIQRYRDFSMWMANYFHPKMPNRAYWHLRLAYERRRYGWAPEFIHDGGWHFSYLGGVERIIEKIEAFAHTEYNSGDFKDPARIEAAIAKGEDIFGRDLHYRFVPLDGSYPRYVRQHQDRFAKYIGGGPDGAMRLGHG